MKGSKTLKAFVVQETEEQTGDVYYAVHAITARRAGADEYAEGHLSGVTCNRAPWADKYAPGPCPKLAMIDHGWWYECHGCNATLTCDGVDEDHSDGRGHIDRCRFVEIGNGVFCTAECRMRDRNEKAARLRHQRRAISDLKDSLLKLLPDVKPIALHSDRLHRAHAHVAKQADGTWATEQCVIGFEWPGMTVGHATYRFDKPGEEPHVGVCHGDLEAWHAWRTSVNPNYEAATNG
jgi:hypothetical protein